MSAAFAKPSRRDADVQVVVDPRRAVVPAVLDGSAGLGAPFVNLDFEQAQVVFTTPPIYISVAAAFPGWQVLANG